MYDDPASAIAREKVLKKWRRAWKFALIEENNRDWVDRYGNLMNELPFT
jgi:putative endonuclease